MIPPNRLASDSPGPVLGEGREAIVYALDNSRVLKVFRDLPEADVRAVREFEVAGLLYSSGLGVARPIELTRWQARPALVSQRITGRSLNRELARRPSRLYSVAAKLAGVQVALRRVTAPAHPREQLPVVHDVVAARLHAADGVPRPLVDAALGVLGRLPGGDRLCHGNLHLGNVLLSSGVAVLVDCGDSAIGDPHAEIAHTVVRYHCARLRGHGGRLTRVALVVVSAIGRRPLGACYLRAYRRLAAADGATVDGGLVSAWVGVRAVERMAEGHRRERRRLTRLANRHLPA